MLMVSRSSRLSFLLTGRGVERRNPDVAIRVRLIFSAPCICRGRYVADGDTLGGRIGVILGGGSAGILAALPMPLGSLIEPLSPRAFAGPGAMPLTPASWAGNLPGAARRPSPTRLTNATLAIIPREKIESSCARVMAW